MINISKINHLKFIDIMADIFKKPNCKPFFQPPPPPGHHHCRPNINININNDDNGTSDSSVSPIIVDLINRINKVENRVDDVEEDIDLSKVEIGEESGQAYPGEKGAKNALEIELLKSNSNSVDDFDKLNNFIGNAAQFLYLDIDKVIPFLDKLRSTLSKGYDLEDLCDGL